METLQIRLPKPLLDKVDQLVKSGFYRSRSEILRQAIQKFIVESNFNGSLPFIVGPFQTLDFGDLFDRPPDAYRVSEKDLADIQKRVQDLNVET